MKSQKFSITRKITLAAALTVVLAVSAAILLAQSNGETNTFGGASICGPQTLFECLRERQAQQLEGSWAVTISPVRPGVPSFRGYLTLARGGALIGSDRTRPFGSPQHGIWEHRGGNEFAATFVQDLFDVMGNFQGNLTGRLKLTLTGVDQFVGVANAEIRDAAGNITLSACSTVRGERIKVEPLAPQCQSITPPQ